MAELKSICLGSECMDLTEYLRVTGNATSGGGITATIPHSTATNVELYTSDFKGFAIVTISVSFPTNSTGVRAVILQKQTGGSTQGVSSQYRLNPASSGQTYMSVLYLGQIAVGDKIIARTQQTSGSDMTVTYGYNVLKFEQ